MAIFNSYVSLPEGKPPFSYGFPMVFLWIPYLPYGEIVGKPKGFDRWWQPPRFVQAQPAGAGRYTCSLRYSAGGSKGTPSRWIAAWRRISWWFHGDFMVSSWWLAINNWWFHDNFANENGVFFWDFSARKSRWFHGIEWADSCVFFATKKTYPLVMTNITMERSTIL